ncbi:MAG: hypothetical protein ACYCX5_04620 [Coriobacteriia bacterium]
MEKGKKVVLGTAIAAALATSALVAGMAFAAPGIGRTPATSPAATPNKAATVAAPAETADVNAVDGDNVQDENGADDATEAKSTEAKGEKESASAETDGVDHQFEGEEVGNNGDGVPDANEAAETK